MYSLNVFAEKLSQILKVWLFLVCILAIGFVIGVIYTKNVILAEYPKDIGEINSEIRSTFNNK